MGLVRIVFYIIIVGMKSDIVRNISDMKNVTINIILLNFVLFRIMVLYNILVH